MTNEKILFNEPGVLESEDVSLVAQVLVFCHTTRVIEWVVGLLAALRNEMLPNEYDALLGSIAAMIERYFAKKEGTR